jgi:hypothetical protein
MLIWVAITYSQLISLDQGELIVSSSAPGALQTVI